jgi:CHAT domain
MMKDRMKWLFEVYPVESPFESEKAKMIAAEIHDYGESLLEQIGLFEFIFRNLHDSESDFITLDIQGSSAFHTLSWEAMEKPYHAKREDGMPRLLVRRQVISTGGTRESISDIELQDGTKRSFNILLVVSRPDKASDVDPLLSPNAIMDVLRLLKAKQKDLPFKSCLEIARPGTWTAFAEHLKSRTEQWWRKGGSGPWFDIIHFDVHGSIHNGEAYLHFLTRNGSRTLLKSASSVGQYLHHYKTSFVLINACESASLSSAERSCMARTLVECGVETVIGMAFKLTSSAAKVLIKAFYFRLLSPLLDGVAALWVARTALREYATRTGRFGLRLQLHDYIIPVIFVSAHSNSDPFFQWTRVSGRDNTDFANNCLRVSKDKLLESTFSHAGEVETSSFNQPIIGREQDILELEWIMLRRSRTGTRSFKSSQSIPPQSMLISGSAGVGKTSLALFLGSWWTSTGLVKSVHYWNMNDFLSAHIESKDHENSTTSSLDEGDQGFQLYIVDQMESKTCRYVSSGLSTREKEAFIQTVRRISGPKHFIILISRLREEWLEIPIEQRYQLHGLSHYDATIMASSVLGEIGLGHLLEQKENATYLQFLMHRLWYNPLSIRHFIKSMKSKESLEPSQTPKELFNRLLVLPGFIDIDEGSNTTIKDINLFIEFVARWGRQCGDEQGISEAVFGLLCLCSGTCDEEWRNSIFVDTFTDISWRLICSMLSRCLEEAGWVEKFVPSNTSIAAYFRLHPLFLNTIRSMCYNRYWKNGDKLSRLKSHFLLRQVKRISDISQQSQQTLSNTQLPRQTQMEIEGLNYFIAVDDLLLSLQQSSSSEQADLECAEAYIILRTLWDAARKSSSPSLDMEMVLKRILPLSHILEERMKEMTSNTDQETMGLEILLSLTGRLSEYYMQLDTTRAGCCVNLTLHYVSKHPIRTSKWDDILWLTFTRCLIYRGYNCISEGDLDESKSSFELAICVLRLVELRYPKFDIGKFEILAKLQATRITPGTTELSGDSATTATNASAPNLDLEVPRSTYDLAIFRHAALSGLRVVSQMTRDGREEDYEDRCNDVVTFIALAITERDKESLVASLFLSFKHYDIR